MKEEEKHLLAEKNRERTLKERATILARPESAPSGLASNVIEIVEFILAGERYAFESGHVREICPLVNITPLPGVPAFVAGIINVRSEIISLIDIKKFFDLPEKGITNLNKVIILNSPEMELGVLADEVIGSKRLNADKLEKTLATLVGIREEYLKGVTADRCAVLDALRLLSDKKIIVREGAEK